MTERIGNEESDRKWSFKHNREVRNPVLVDLHWQRCLYIDIKGPQWCVSKVTGLKVLSSSCLAFKQLLHKQNLHLPTTCFSLLALCCSISEESNKKNTDRKLSEALSCNPRHLFLWKSGGCHLSFNQFPLLYTRSSINITIPSKWGNLIIGLHLILNQGYCFAEDRDKAQPSLQTSSPSSSQVSSSPVCRSKTL